MSGPKRNPDRLNTIGVVVVGICGAVLVYVVDRRAAGVLRERHVRDPDDARTTAARTPRAKVATRPTRCGTSTVRRAMRRLRRAATQTFHIPIDHRDEADRREPRRPDAIRRSCAGARRRRPSRRSSRSSAGRSRSDAAACAPQHRRARAAGSVGTGTGRPTRRAAHAPAPAAMRRPRRSLRGSAARDRQAHATVARRTASPSRRSSLPSPRARAGRGSQATADDYVPRRRRRTYKASGVTVDEHLGANAAARRRFRTSEGKHVTLGGAAAATCRRSSRSTTPTARCCAACSSTGCRPRCRSSSSPAQRDGKIRGVRLGAQFRIVTIDLEPNESLAKLAADEGRATSTACREAQREAARTGWTFLSRRSGDATQIRRVADAVGFHYVYMPERAEWAHPAALIFFSARRRGHALRLRHPVRDRR